MPRRREVPKREILPDPKFNNVEVAKRALAQGLPSVGILDSKDFAGLHPGYLVVFSGVYSSESEAGRHLSEATAAGFSAAYARQVTR